MAGKKSRQLQLKQKAIDLKGKVSVRAHSAYNYSTKFIHRHPLSSFLIVFGLFILVLILGRLFQKAPDTQSQASVTKNVSIYGIGESPKATFQAKIEKTGVIKIIAQSPGIVQEVSVKEGDKVNKGQQIVSLANNYQGGNSSSLQRQIAQTQYQNVLDTFDTQNGLIQNQRNVATASAQQAQDTRDITRKSIDDTNALINNEQTQLDQINVNIDTLKANDPTNSEIQTLQDSANSLQGAIQQLNGAKRTSDYQSNNDNPPAQISRDQKDIALKQLDIQQKSLELNKQVSRLQVDLAYVAEATMYPASPFNGTVERINVHPGENITAGTVIATIAADDIATTAILLVPQEIAQFLSVGEPSELTINSRKIAITPYHVSSEATDGQLYSVFYDIPQDQQNKLSDGEYINVQVPISTAKTTSADPLIPIDAVYLSQSNAQVLVTKNNQATAKTITLGKVYGDYVEVISGLQNGDEIITDRNVVAGDKITINK